MVTMIPTKGRYYLRNRHSTLQKLDYKKPFEAVPLALTANWEYLGSSQKDFLKFDRSEKLACCLYDSLFAGPQEPQ